MMSLIPGTPKRIKRRSIFVAPTLIRHAGMRCSFRNCNIAVTVACSTPVFLDMSPSFPSLNKPDVTSINAEMMSNASCRDCALEGSDHVNILTSQFCAPGTLSFRPSMARAPLSDAICYVVGLCAKEEMHRIDTDWDIASMEHLLTIRDSPAE